MRTTKPTSTVSFNTRSFLAIKLDELTKAKRISFWAFISHKPEEDEKKEHIHLFIEPSKMLQTDDLKEELKEFDPNYPDKPLGCISFVSSKFADWYLYVIHDAGYLAMKNQERKFRYHTSDIVTNDPDDLDFRISQIDMMSISPYSAMEDAMRHGVTFEQFFQRGSIPIMQVTPYKIAWDMLLRAKHETKRDAGRTHNDNEWEMS